tara:strand:- start:213 stop:590 length:378 start_codon:yes stop_codon:yes gene_type:complete
MSEIIIYSNEQCPYCKQVKDRLDKENIKYINKFTKDYKKEWDNISNLTGIPQVPTIYFKDNYFVPGRDFGNEDHLINIINNFNTSSFSTERISLERIKTLNYSMNMAFGRLDQTLRQIEDKLKNK